MSVCRECLMTIKWVRMEDTAKLVCVQPIPDPQGTVAARPGPRGADGHRTLIGYVIAKDRPLRAGYTLYLAHHGECERHTLTPRRGALSNTPPPTLFD